MADKNYRTIQFGSFTINDLECKKQEELNYILNKLDGSDMPLGHAIKIKNLKVIEYLLLKGADITKKSDYGLTPLQIAVQVGNLYIIKYLCEHGATDTIQSAFYTAIEKGNTEIISYLLKQGALINFHHNYKNLPLTMAVATKNLCVTKFLIENGADVNRCVANYLSPLTQAAVNGDLDMVQLLLEKGANIDGVDGFKKTALDHAVSFENIRTAVYLIKAGAKPQVADTQVGTFARENDDFKMCLEVNNLYYGYFT